jgi:hypothetical protein
MWEVKKALGNSPKRNEFAEEIEVAALNNVRTPKCLERNRECEAPAELRPHRLRKSIALPAEEWIALR